MKKGLILSIFIITLNSPLAQAREKIGNGGGGYSCKTSSGEIASVHLLDLFEGTLPLFPRTQGYHYQNDSFTIEQELQRALDRASVNPGFASELSKAIHQVHEVMVMLPKPARLEVTEDANPEVRMKDCEFVQIANYVVEDGSKQRLDVVEEFYQKMDLLNQASLIVHEAVYLLARQYSLDQTSVRSRMITSMLMAKDELSSEIYEETSKLFSEPVDEKNVSLALNQCKPDSILTISASIEGEAEHLELLVKFSESISPLTLEAPKKGNTSKEIQIACSDFKFFKWRLFNFSSNDLSHPCYFTINTKIDQQHLFSISKRTSEKWLFQEFFRSR